MTDLSPEGADARPAAAPSTEVSGSRARKVAAETMDRVLRPRSIAIVGASEKSFYAANTLGNLLKTGFPGALYPVNPSGIDVFGLPTYRSLAEVPEAPDNVVVLVRRELVPQVVTDAISRGAGGLTIMSAGFSEAGDDEGQRLHTIIQESIVDSGIPLIGPNCLGFMNGVDRTALWSAPLRGTLRPGPVAVVTQSGGSSGALYRSLLERELGLSWFITAGNQALLEVADYVEYLVEDPEVKILVCFIEGVHDGERFVRAARRARDLGKPIVVLKTGRSERGRAAAFAHTGSMAGSDAVYDAVFQKLGIIRVGDFEELVETVALLSAARQWPGPVGRPAILSVSGGACALIADKAEDHGLVLSRLSPKTIRALRDVMPASGNPSNPIDVTGQALQDLSIYEAVVSVLEDDPDVQSVVHVLSSGIPAAGSGQHSAVLDLIVARAETSSAFPILCSLNKQNLSAEQRGFLRSHPQIGYVEGLGAGLRAIAHVARGPAVAVERQGQRELGPSTMHHGEPAGEAHHRRVLDEASSLAVLERYGIPTVSREFAATAEQCAKVATGMGFPIVLKLAAVGVAHKSRIGGVALNLTTADQVRDEALAMLERVAADAAGLDVDGFLLQKQAPPGLEIIVGATRDEQFGPVVVIGAGGVHAELLADRVIVPTPADADDIRAALARLRIGELLSDSTRFRPMDVDGVVGTALAVQEMISHHPEVLDLDINPLLVYPDRVLAVDALVVERADQPAR